MHNEKIHLIRIKRLLERQKQLLIRDKLPLETGFSATGGDFQPLALNSVWGKPWQTGWFRISGSILKTGRERITGCSSIATAKPACCWMAFPTRVSHPRWIGITRPPRI